MIRLVRVEIRRATSRKLVRRLVLAAVVALAVMSVVLFLTTDPVVGGGDVRQPDPAMEQALRAGCMEHNGGADAEEMCSYLASEAARQRTGDTGNHVRLADAQEVLGGTSFILFIAALCAAGSFVGAEWRYGTLAALLTWEPRRARVLLAKLAAALVVGGVVAVALQMLAILAIMPAVLAHGDTAGTDAAFWQDTVGLVLRIAAITDLAIAVGFAIATVTRNAGAAIGGAFIWFAVIEGILRGLRPGWNDWLLGNNAAVFLLGDESGLLTRSMTAAGLYLLALAAGLTAAATLWFRRIDVQ